MADEGSKERLRSPVLRELVRRAEAERDRLTRLMLREINAVLDRAVSKPETEETDV